MKIIPVNVFQSSSRASATVVVTITMVRDDVREADWLNVVQSFNDCPGWTPRIYYSTVKLEWKRISSTISNMLRSGAFKKY